jgi:hypothetical protein
VQGGCGATLLPMQVITKGTTQNALCKFLDGSSFTELGGGCKAKATAIVRRTVNEHGLLAEHPPYYQDATTGHMTVAGNKTHWTNESTLRLWVDAIVWPAHQKDCEECGADPDLAKTIVNIDCYPVHISKSFQAWLKHKYSQLCMVNVLPKCTSKAQFADVVLNKPFKNYYSRAHTLFLMRKVKEHLAHPRGPERFELQPDGYSCGHTGTQVVSAGVSQAG